MDVTFLLFCDSQKWFTWLACIKESGREFFCWRKETTRNTFFFLPNYKKDKGSKPQMSKKGQGKGKSAGKSNPADAAVDEKRAALSAILRQCDAYERMMVVCSEQLQRSKLESLNLKKRIAELNSKFEEQEKHTNDKCIGMHKMYRSAQAQLFTRIEAHQIAIDGLRKQLNDAKEKLEQTKAQKDAEIAEKTKKINEQKQKMEEMAISFGIRLKETLERMSDHIQGEIR